MSRKVGSSELPESANHPTQSAIVRPNPPPPPIPDHEPMRRRPTRFVGLRRTSRFGAAAGGGRLGLAGPGLAAAERQQPAGRQAAGTDREREPAVVTGPRQLAGDRSR